MKTYKYKDLELKAKPVNLELRKNSLLLWNEFIEKLQDEFKELKKAKLPDPNDFDGEDDPLYKAAVEESFEKQGDFVIRFGFTAQLFLMDENRLRELFTKFLDVDDNILAQIDFEAKTDEEYQELMSLGVEILSDFFSISRNLTFGARR